MFEDNGRHGGGPDRPGQGGAARLRAERSGDSENGTDRRLKAVLRSDEKYVSPSGPGDSVVAGRKSTGRHHQIQVQWAK